MFIDIKNRREVFWENSMIIPEHTTAELKLHHPVKKEFALAFDAPWEAAGVAYPMTVKDGDKALCTGTAGQLTRENVTAAEDILPVGQRQNLTVTFHYPENGGNESENLDLLFTLCAEATQTKNNPNKLFE